MVEWKYIYTDDDFVMYVYDDGTYLLKDGIAIIPLTGKRMKELILFLKKVKQEESLLNAASTNT